MLVVELMVIIFVTKGSPCGIAQTLHMHDVGQISTGLQSYVLAGALNGDNSYYFLTQCCLITVYTYSLTVCDIVLTHCINECYRIATLYI